MSPACPIQDADALLVTDPDPACLVKIDGGDASWRVLDALPGLAVKSTHLIVGTHPDLTI